MRSINIPDSAQREVLAEQSSNVTDLIENTRARQNDILSGITHTQEVLSEQEAILANVMQQELVLNRFNRQFGSFLEGSYEQKLAA